MKIRSPAGMTITQRLSPGSAPPRPNTSAPTPTLSRLPTARPWARGWSTVRLNLPVLSRMKEMKAQLLNLFCMTKINMQAILMKIYPNMTHSHNQSIYTLINIPLS